MTSRNSEPIPRVPGELDTLIDRLESQALESNFDALLDLATKTFLTDPLPVAESGSRMTERQYLVSMYGLTGLRAALELDMGIETMDAPEYEANEEEIPEGKFYVHTDSPLRTGLETRDPLNLPIARQVEQFGKALIDESLAILGADSGPYVEMMKSKDASEQEKALKWLYARINDMKKVELNIEVEHSEDTEIYMYHPIYMSPKVVGEYPDIHALPSCLGASIIAAGFFEKTGVPYMHAGMQQSSLQKRLNDSVKFFATSMDIFNQKNSDIASPYLADKTLEFAHVAVSSMIHNRGYHAGTTVQLADGRWYVFDPYYDVMHPIPSESSNKRMDDTYKTLLEFHDDAPGLELSYDSRLLTAEKGLHKAVSDGTLLYKDPATTQKIAAMMAIDPEMAMDRIYSEIIDPHFRSAIESDDPDIAIIFKSIYESIDSYPSDDSKDYVRQAFEDIYQNYVLWQDKPGNVAKRMLEDKRYFADRMLDVVYLPIFMATLLASRNLEHGYVGIDLPGALELGLPHNRIGHAVLSDFAAYTDDPLPPSFWFAQWSSLVPITETIDRSESKTQQKMGEFMARWAEQRDLTYVNAYSIIKKHISDREKEEYGKRD